MDTRSLFAALSALLFIHPATASDASADQANVPPPAQESDAVADTSAASTSDALGSAETTAAPTTIPAPANTPKPNTMPPPGEQTQAPSPSSSGNWIGSPQQYRTPTLAEQFTDLQRSVQELEEERQRRLREEAPTWAVHVNPLNLLLDEVLLGVDYGLLDRLQLTAQASYFDTRINVTESNGGSVGAGVRLYPTSNGYRGWYVSPTVSFSAGAAENVVTGENADIRALVAAAITGYQWIWDPILLRAGVGAGRVWDVGSKIDGRMNTGLTGWKLALDGAFGMVF